MIYNYLKGGYFDAIQKISGLTVDDTKQKIAQRAVADVIDDFKYCVMDDHSPIKIIYFESGKEKVITSPVPKSMLHDCNNLMCMIVHIILNGLNSFDFEQSSSEGISFYASKSSFYNSEDDNAKLFYIDSKTIRKLNSEFDVFADKDYIVHSLPFYSRSSTSYCKIVQNTVVIYINYNISVFNQKLYKAVLTILSDIITGRQEGYMVADNYRVGLIYTAEMYNYIYDILQQLNILKSKKEYSIYDLIGKIAVKQNEVKNDFEILSRVLSDQPLYKGYYQIPVKFEVNFNTENCVVEDWKDAGLRLSDMKYLSDDSLDTGFRRRGLFHFKTV